MSDSAPDTARDVEATKSLLSWMRENSYWCDTLTVGTVQIVGARDYDPSVKARVNAAAANQGDQREDDGSIYDTVGRGMPGYEAMRGEKP